MSARRVVAVLAAVVAIPTACLLGVLALGRALEESQVAEGTLTTPEEAARRAEENRRRFLAMTPAEHLAGARYRLSLNPRPGLGAGGDLHGATLHLDAIAPDAGVRAEVAALRDEIDQRRLRIYATFEGYVLRLGPTVHAPAPADREALVDALQRATDAPCIHAREAEGTTLQIGAMPCDARLTERLRTGPARARLLSLGFRAVRCELDPVSTRRGL